MKFVIIFPKHLEDIFFRIAAERECSVEKIIIEALEKRIERMAENAE